MLEKQIYMHKFCKELIEVALHNDEKSRNIDTLKLCEAKLRDELTIDSLYEIQKKIEYVLMHMKNSAVSSNYILDSKQETQQEVRSRIRQILEKCVADGEAMKNTYVVSGIGQVHKIKESVNDYMYVEANYETMCNPVRLQEQCVQLAQNYDMEIQKLGTELIMNVSTLYSDSMRHIEKMIISLERGCLVNGMKELYEKWDNRMEYAEDSVRQKVMTLDSGKKYVIQFSEKSKQLLQKIKRKNKRKQIWMRFCPILIIVLLIVAFVSYGQVKKNINESNVQVEKSDDSLVGQVQEKVQDTVKNQLTKQVTLFGMRAVFIIVIPLLILFGIAYVGWNVYTNKVFRARMIQDIGRIMNEQVNEFVTSNDMESVQEEYLTEIIRLLNESYGALIVSIFGELVTAPLEKSSSITRDIESRWTIIKNMEVV